MAHNYEEFPFPEFKHAIKSGKNTYRNKFFHDIDLSFLLKWMESIEGENYTIRIVGDKLQLIDGEGQVVSEVTLSEGQQGPPGVTPNVNAAAFVDDGTGTPSVEVVKTGTTENPTFSFNFSNLKGATGATGPASTVPGPAGTPFQVKAQYDTYAEMIAAHPTGEVGDAYQVGENSGLATVATTGDYNDLINKPSIPAAQVNSDWNANSGAAQILNKPTIPTVNNPTITITQGGVTKGSFTLNQSSNQTIDVDAGGGGGSTLKFAQQYIQLTENSNPNISGFGIDCQLIPAYYENGRWNTDWSGAVNYNTGFVAAANINWGNSIPNMEWTTPPASSSYPDATDSKWTLAYLMINYYYDDNTLVDQTPFKDMSYMPIIGAVGTDDVPPFMRNAMYESANFSKYTQSISDNGARTSIMYTIGKFGEDVPNNYSLVYPSSYTQLAVVVC